MKKPMMIKVSVPPPSKEFMKQQKVAAEAMYNDNYQFKHPSSVRSPASPWETEHIKRGDSYNTISPKEKALVIGSPSNFGHKGAQVQGKLRVSGKSDSYHIGKRPK